MSETDRDAEAAVGEGEVTHAGWAAVADEAMNPDAGIERIEDLDEELARQYEHLEEYADVPDLYECKFGHRTHGEFRYRSASAATGELEADSGPMCRVCMLKTIGSKFRAKLVPLKVGRN